MNRYRIGDEEIDSVELKCLLVSRGVRVERAVYQAFSSVARLDINPLACNTMILSDGTIAQLTDTGFHLRYLSGILSWDTLKLMRYASDLETPFSVKLHEGAPVLMHRNEPVDIVSFPPKTGFYRRRTLSGLPYAGNAVIQGLDWVAFQCLWSCEYAAAGKACAFCFSGAAFEALAAKGKPMPPALPPRDLAEIIAYAAEEAGISGVQITGGSTHRGETESAYVQSYLDVIARTEIRGLTGEILLYITPPEDRGRIDAYFAQGVHRIACSLELWDASLAAAITPGKIALTTRERHLAVLEYIAEKYGPGKAFSNFIIGIEPFDSLREGAVYLAERGIIPSASVWMPMGRPVMGSMRAPDLAYYRKVKDLFAELYVKHGLEPAGARGLNVCIERDIWRCAHKKAPARG